MDELEVIQTYQRTNSLNQCSKLFNVSRDKIKQILEKNNIQYSKTPQKKSIPNISKQNLLELYLVQNLSILEISKKYSIPLKQTAKLLKEYNIEIRNPHKKKFDVSKEQLEELYKTLSQTEIAKRYNVTVKVVSNRLEEFGIIKRKHSISIKEFAIPKIEQTNFEKYGVKSLFNNQNFQKYCFESRLKKYGTINFNMLASEQEVLNFVNVELGCDFKKDGLILQGKELDGYDENLKIAIEYCGLYWHSERFKDNKYHFDKFMNCKNKHITLITIFEDEWKNRNFQVKSFLKSKLGKNSIRLNARECSVNLIDKQIALEFINQYHIQEQSKKNIKYAFGIFKDSVLLGVMSFGKHHRNNQENSIILNRLVFKNDITIRGGASKLLKHAVPALKGVGYDKIISWSDNRWSVGKVYEKLGFLKEAELPYDYSYVHRKNRIPKQNCTRKKLGCVGKESEHEKAFSKGLLRIYDCGKVRWGLKI